MLRDAMPHPPFTIRATRQEDVGQLPDLECSAAQSFKAHPDLAFLAQEPAAISVEEHSDCLAKQNSWVVVDAAQRLWGFLCAETHGDTLHILELFVAQVAQGQGLGTALMLEACTQALTRHYRRMTLTTFESVPWNRPFYEKLGFVKTVPTQQDGFLLDILREEAAFGFLPGVRCVMHKLLAG
ncbi:GCN5 family N-acetyltransferase [Acetobacter cibinongensis]|uniref:Acetyltransferase n=1 Tax=Acetobacter cibinongensis TaxID=146475 RepID=A0A0D6N4S4_9PROT|nr:GNAT family N-acetyltransferase [Acetobacter cibinongensis]GAN61007.1 acetyltransferase [Acetobacter cibinongensis]GBQ12999.1 histone acetyltransferase HPA2 [Acetobacter cibinongensis NRIC 0482]GEL58496.1 GCN5 family N-acetyltransferase [Acetobacter cibinongensis]